MDDLTAHHQTRLDAAVDKCAQPTTATDVIPALFTREIGIYEFSFAIGETLAHLNYLVDAGDLARVCHDDGLIRYCQPE